MRGEHGATIHRVARLLKVLQAARIMPAQAALARELGISKRQVRRYLTEAEAAGWPMPARRESEAA